MTLSRVQVVDSHTAGEPTRVVIAGGPNLGAGTLNEMLEEFRRHDRFRSAVLSEPRGSDVLVGAVLCEPSDPSCSAAVIFFNNVGLLGMCGHGTIGVIATLEHMGRIQCGVHRIETPVGPVTAQLNADASVRVVNVPSHRKARSVCIDVPGVGVVIGDVAWGGNWFFLIGDHGRTLDLADVDELADYCWRVRKAINAQGFPDVDHIELFSPRTSGADSRNFVLCPGKAYDRSPCGTGTSAKLACLAADGKLEEHAPWVQESIVGSTFVGQYRWLDRAAGVIEPTITGRAFITAEATLLFDDHDPFCWGIR